MSSDGGLLWNVKKDDSDDELSILAGHTRLVSSQRGSRNPSPSRQYNPSPPLFSAAGQLPQHKSHDTLGQPHLPLNVPSAYLQHTPPRLPHTPSIADAWVSSSISSESRSQQYQSALGVDERLPSHYPYITSTAHHQHPESTTALGTYGWSNDPRLQHHNQSQRCVSSASSSSSSTGAHQLPSSQQQPIHSHQSPTNQQPPQHQQLQHHNEHQYHAAHVGTNGGSPLDVSPSSHHSHVYPSQPHLLQDLLPPPSVRPLEQSSVYSMYGSSSDSNSRSSVYHGVHPSAQSTPEATPNMDLAHLGIASRDSRLDERWGSFMTESGLLEVSRWDAKSAELVLILPVTPLLTNL